MTPLRLEHRLDQKGKETILGTVKNIMSSHVIVTSVRQRDAIGLGNAVLCTKHLLNNEPFAVLLPDVLVLDQESRDKNYSFAAMVDARNVTGVDVGVGVMVERVGLDDMDNYGVADLNGATSEPFNSIPLMGLVEKPSPENVPSNLAVLGRYIPLTCCTCLRRRLLLLAVRYSSLTRWMSCSSLMG